MSSTTLVKDPSKRELNSASAVASAFKRARAESSGVDMEGGGLEAELTRERDERQDGNETVQKCKCGGAACKGAKVNLGVGTEGQLDNKLIG